MKRLVILLFLFKTCRSIGTDCPEECTCDERNSGLRCDGANFDILSRYLNNIKHLSLVSTRFSPNLWSLICRQTGLESLDLSSNRLAEIPRGCFANMSKLKSLKADYNEIIELKDGTFDGLTSLEEISINSNRIESIDLNVFTNMKNFERLKSIDLSSNSLRTLDTWPLILGEMRRISVNLAFNFISTLTNRLNYNIPLRLSECPNYALELNLVNNMLTHLSHFYAAWSPEADFIRGQCTYTAFRGIKIEKNPIACDCVDYAILTIRRIGPKVRLFNDVPCLLGDMSDGVDPAMMICHVTQDCPNDCRCFQRPFNNTLVVDCSNARLSVFPSKLPSRRTMTYFFTNYLSYDLNMTNSRITSLTEISTGELLKHTSSLDLSHGKLRTIEAQVWNFTQNIKNIFLHDNSLTSLPKEIVNVTLAAKWSLYDNPWSCSCENEWMKYWISSISDRLVGNVFCNSPEWHANKVLLTVDFCYKPPFDYNIVFKISMSSAFGVASTMAIALLVWRRFRHSIFEKYGIRYIWESDECKDEDMSHDVFLVCAEQNISYCRRVLDKLEQVHGFKVLFHSRNFRPGVEIMENIRSAITNSKRTLCLVSKQFLASPWCVEEFNMAYQNDLDKKKKRLLMILLELIDWEGPDIPEEMKVYIKRRTYLELFKLPEKSAWRVLLYSLPIPKPRDSEEDDIALLPA